MFMTRTSLLIATVAGLAASRAVAQQFSLVPTANPKPGAAAPSAAPAVPQLGGASTISYYRVGASEFQPPTYSHHWTPEFPGDRIIFLDPAPVFEATFFATPHLPGGALLRSIEFDNCDTKPTKHLTFSLVDCDYHGECNPVPLASLSSVDNAQGLDCSFVGQDLTSAAYVVDNNLRALSLHVDFRSGDDTNQLAGAIIGYQLQVSPDPPTATFSDVPVGHPFHRFVEALVKAGVTAGYGDGRFGVNDPLTRGQMAVFLARPSG